MTNNYFIFKMAAAAFCFAGMAACTSDIEPSVNDTAANRPILLTGSVQELTLSRAAGTLQNNSLEVTSAGIFVTTGTTAATAILNGDNNQLTVGDDKKTLKPTNGMIWGENKQLNFYAYAPYSADYNGKLGETVTFTVKSNQTLDDNYLASDLLYGTPTSTNPVSAPEDNSTSVNITFKHLMSKVSIKLVNESTSGITFNNPKITLLGVKKSVSFDMVQGTVTATEDETASNLVVTESAEIGTEAAAIVVPQTITQGSNFIQIINNGDTYLCALAADQKFEPGNAYAYTITFESSEIATLECEVTEWGTGSTSDLVAPSKQSTYTYGVGDFIDKSGNLVKKSEASSENADIIGVIFATGDDLSATDIKAGYTAYVLGLYTPAAAKFNDNSAELSSISFGDDYNYLKRLADAAAELDGLTQTGTIQAIGTTSTDYPLFDLTGSSLQNLGTDNFSSWFIPSIGQMIQIFNKLGNAGIPTMDTTNDFYGVVPGWDGSTQFGTAGKNYTMVTSPGRAAVLAALKASTNGQEIIKSGNNYATSSLYKQGEGKSVEYYMVGTKDDFVGSSSSYANSDGWGMASGSNATNRARVVCIATKLNLVVSTTTE